MSKKYGATQDPVIPQLNLDIYDGDFLCLLGPSGCGKTTTLRMIAGLERASSGGIKLDDKLVDSRDDGVFVPPEKRQLGLVFQSYALWPHMTVRENIEFGLEIKKLPRAEKSKTANEVMEKLTIAKFADRYPNQLSGGQQQRVSLARMLAVNPSVLLLDEPLSNLDQKLRLEMRNELRRIHEEFGTTVIFVTHDQWEAMTLSTRIALMKEGELQQVGTPDEIYNKPANQFVAEFVGATPINMVTRTAAAEDLRLALKLEDETSLVSIRPEAINVSRDARERGWESAKIIDIVPTGGNWIVRIRVGDQELASITSTQPNFAPGQEAFVHISNDDVLQFADDGRALG